MKQNYFRKQLVIGLIALCIGASVAASHNVETRDLRNGTGVAGANDLAILRIPSPHMGVLNGPWPVEVLICNLGTTPETLVPIEVTIEKFDKTTSAWIIEYDSTMTISILNPQDPFLVEFPEWTPGDGGVSFNTCIKYQITAVIQGSDPRPINDLHYEIFNLGDGNIITITIPAQTNPGSQFQFTLSSTVPICCPDFEVDVISICPKTTPPPICHQTIGAVTLGTSPITIWVPMPKISGLNFFRIKITIANAKATALGRVMGPFVKIF